MHVLCLTSMFQRSASRLRSGAQGRVLFPTQEQVFIKWTNEEMYALILFLMYHTDGKTWVTHKDDKFCIDAGVLFSICSLPYRLAKFVCNSVTATYTV